MTPVRENMLKQEECSTRSHRYDQCTVVRPQNETPVQPTASPSYHAISAKAMMRKKFVTISVQNKKRSEAAALRKLTEGAFVGRAESVRVAA